MKLIYVTAKKYPSKKVDPFFVKSMAKAFAALLGDDFIFLIRGPIPQEFKTMHTLSLRIPNSFRTLCYFFALPVLTVRQGWSSKETFFLSYDPYLLSILIFWRGVLRFKYRIVSDWHQLFGDWRDAYVAQRSDYLTTTSERLKNLLVSKCGADPQKVRVAYGGVDPQPFEALAVTSRGALRKQLGLPDRSLVGYVGGFTSVGIPKGLDIMIKALPGLKEEIAMVFVGGSKREIEEYQELAEQAGVGERCIFVPKVPFEKVVEYEMAMDILVIPYPDKPHFREYGFPMKVWEYMAAGRPILYSNLPLITEVLGGRATPFAPDSAPGLAGAITAILADKERAETMAARNPTEVQAYTWQARAKHILTFIHS
jgi:glycosyltransferase involved in cell wall biosynthesis